jgi:hypothetical protein
MSGGDGPGCTIRENNSRGSQRESKDASLLNSRIKAKDMESIAGCVTVLKFQRETAHER